MSPEEERAKLEEDLQGLGERVFTEFTKRANEAVEESHRLANRITVANLGLKRGRRRLAIFAFVSIILAAQLQDVHVEHCAVKGQPTGELQTMICNFTFPTHQHSPDTRVIDGPYAPGLVLWAALIAAGCAFHRKRYGFEKRIEDNAEREIRESRRRDDDERAR